MKGFSPAAMSCLTRGENSVEAADLAGGVSWLDRALAADPQCVRAFFYRAGLKIQMGDESGALREFRAIEGLDHRHLTAYADLTTPPSETPAKLAAATERILRAEPRASWAHVFSSCLMKSSGRFREAVQAMSRAVDLRPRSAALWALRAQLTLNARAERNSDGVRDMERAVSLEPRWGWLHCWFGEALRIGNELPRALKSLDRGIALDPGYKRGLAWRGRVLLDLGRYREAVSDLDRSLAWSPLYKYDRAFMADQKSWSYGKKMQAHRALGDWASALKDLNHAHGLAPRYVWVFNPAGDPQVWKRGVEELDSYIKKCPQDSWAWAWRGWTLHQAGRNEAALSSLARASRLQPSAAWPRAWRGKVLTALGRDVEASAALGAALKRDPDYAPALGWRAEIRRRKGDLKGARADADLALKLDPRLVLVYVTRAMVKQALKDYAGQFIDMRRAMRLDPSLFAQGAQ